MVTIYPSPAHSPFHVLFSNNTIGRNEHFLSLEYYTGADKIITWFLSCPIILVDLQDDILFEAAKIKAHYPISYADCFVAATAIVNNGSILTGDPEFKKISALVKIAWVPVK